MTKEKIFIDKISTLLETALDDECGALYLMVEIRKLLEFTNEFSKFPELSLFCDWCLHSKLSRKRAVNKLLEIEKQLWDNAEAKEEINNLHFFEFKEFKNELISFFTQNNIIGENFLNSLDKFIKNISSILLEHPLVIDRPKCGQIKTFYFVEISKDKNSIACSIDFEKDNNGVSKSYTLGSI